MTDSTTYLLQFSNNSDQAVQVLRGFADSGSTDVGYQQNLLVLPMKDENGSSISTVTSGSTVSVTMDKEQPTILACLKDGYFTPVYETSPEYPSDIGDDSDPTATVSSGAFEVMKSALGFRQNVMANPMSTMAQDFQTTMNDNPTSIETVVNSWFADHPPCTGVTWSYYTSAQSWLSTFASSWVMKNSTTDEEGSLPTYYVFYSGTGDYSSQLGTITVSVNSSATSNDVDDHLVGYEITWQPEDGDSLSLQFNNSTLTDSSGTVNLDASFKYKNLFTTKASDIDTLWPCLVGTIGATNVIAIPMQPTDSGSGPSSFWSKETLDTAFEYFMSTMMFIMVLDFIYVKGKAASQYLKEKFGNKETTDAEKEEARQYGQENAGKLNAENEVKLQKVSNDNSRSLPTTDAEIELLGSSTKNLHDACYNLVAKDQTKYSYEQTENTLRKLTEIQSNESTEAASASLREAGSNYRAGEYKLASENITEANVHLSTALQNMTDVIDEQTQKLYLEEIEYNKLYSERARQTAEDYEDAKDNKTTEDTKADEYLPEYSEAVA